jgi:hypothetical protein
MGPTGDAGQLEDTTRDDRDYSLIAARDAFPEWDLHEVLGGYIAVPAGTPVVRGMFVASIVEKLRARQGPASESAS